MCMFPSPENCFDVSSFFDSLLSNFYDFYEYQKLSLSFICGDCNNRCGELDDFIAGVDSVGT